MIFFNTHARCDTKGSGVFAGSEFGGCGLLRNGGKRTFEIVGCSPRYTQMVPTWPLAGQLSSCLNHVLRLPNGSHPCSRGGTQKDPIVFAQRVHGKFRRDLGSCRTAGQAAKARRGPQDGALGACRPSSLFRCSVGAGGNEPMGGGGGGCIFRGVCAARLSEPAGAPRQERKGRNGVRAMGVTRCWTCQGRSRDKRFRGTGRGTLQSLLVHQGFLFMYPPPFCISYTLIPETRVAP